VSWLLVPSSFVPQRPSLAFPSIPPPPPPRHPRQQSHRNPSKPNTVSGIGASVRFEEEGWNGRLGLDWIWMVGVNGVVEMGVGKIELILCGVGWRKRGKGEGGWDDAGKR